MVYSTSIERTITMTTRENYCQRTYGISEETADNLLAQNAGNCWICNNPPKVRALAIDHNHTDGNVRGRLCHRCNKLLGTVRDDPALLLQAYLYASFWDVVQHYATPKPEFAGSIKSKIRRNRIAKTRSTKSVTIITKKWSTIKPKQGQNGLNPVFTIIFVA